MATVRVPLLARAPGLRVGKQSQRRGGASGFNPRGVAAAPASAPGGSLADMQVTLVSVSVTPGDEEDFAHESIANAASSLEESDNIRFDVLRSIDDPGKFTLVEVYKTPHGPVLHKESEHYIRWRENVSDMMAEPRTARKFNPVYPWPGLWGTAAASRRQVVDDEEPNPVAENETAPTENNENMASTFLALDSDDANAAHVDMMDMIDSFGDTIVITHVHVNCVPGTEDEFAEASTANAASSVLEPGNLRFDVLRDATDGSKFLLIEVYDTAESAAAHKQTPHYVEWRKTVEEMMAAPRQATTYIARFPEDEKHWKMTLSDA